MLPLNVLVKAIQLEAALDGAPSRDGCPGVRSPDDPRVASRPPAEELDGEDETCPHGRSFRSGCAECAEEADSRGT